MGVVVCGGEALLEALVEALLEALLCRRSWCSCAGSEDILLLLREQVKVSQTAASVFLTPGLPDRSEGVKRLAESTALYRHHIRIRVT